VQTGDALFKDQVYSSCIVRANAALALSDGPKRGSLARGTDPTEGIAVVA